MNQTSLTYASPSVAVYGLVGHDEELLTLHRHGEPVHYLPGGLVRASECVQQALRRLLREQLHVDITQLDFCATVEHHRHPVDVGEPPAYELALLFDVTLPRPHGITPEPGISARWVSDTNLDHIDLHPACLADGLRRGALNGERPWWPAFP